MLAYSTFGCSFCGGIIGPRCCSPSAGMSSCDASPGAGFLADLRGNRIRFSRYALRRSALRVSDSSHRFVRRWSTAMPMVRAKRGGMPAACRARCGCAKCGEASADADL